MNVMRKLPLPSIAIVALVAQLVVTGCGSGGSGSSAGGSIFGSIFSGDLLGTGSTTDGVVEAALSAFESSSSVDSTAVSDSDDSADLTKPADSGDSGSSSGDSTIPKIARIHHPEPASLALFGGGLAVAAAARRRRKTRQLQA